MSLLPDDRKYDMVKSNGMNYFYDSKLLQNKIKHLLTSKQIDSNNYKDMGRYECDLNQLMMRDYFAERHLQEKFKRICIDFINGHYYDLIIKQIKEGEGKNEDEINAWDSEKLFKIVFEYVAGDLSIAIVERIMKDN